MWGIDLQGLDPARPLRLRGKAAPACRLLAAFSLKTLLLHVDQAGMLVPKRARIGRSDTRDKGSDHHRQGGEEAQCRRSLSCLASRSRRGRRTCAIAPCERVGLGTLPASDRPCSLFSGRYLRVGWGAEPPKETMLRQRLEHLFGAFGVEELMIGQPRFDFVEFRYLVAPQRFAVSA